MRPDSSEYLAIVVWFYPHFSLVWMEPVKMNLTPLGTGHPRWCSVTLQLYFALQNSASSASTRRACSLTKSVSVSCSLSGKQTPSSVLCVQSKSFHNLFSTVRSHPPLQGEWNFPQICGLRRWGDMDLPAVMLWYPFCFQVQPEDSKRTGHVSVWPVHPISCECSSHRSALPLPTCTYFLK